MSKEPFRFQYHTNIGGRNYRTVIELLRKVLKDNYLNIEVTEVPCAELQSLTEKCKRYEEALELISNFYYDCLDCEGLIDKGLICERHLDVPIHLAREALSQK